MGCWTSPHEQHQCGHFILLIANICLRGIHPYRYGMVLMVFVPPELLTACGCPTGSLALPFACSSPDHFPCFEWSAGRWVATQLRVTAYGLELVDEQGEAVGRQRMAVVGCPG